MFDQGSSIGRVLAFLDSSEARQRARAARTGGLSFRPSNPASWISEGPVEDSPDNTTRDPSPNPQISDLGHAPATIYPQGPVQTAEAHDEGLQEIQALLRLALEEVEFLRDLASCSRGDTFGLRKARDVASNALENVRQSATRAVLQAELGQDSAALTKATEVRSRVREAMREVSLMTSGLDNVSVAEASTSQVVRATPPKLVLKLPTWGGRIEDFPAWRTAVEAYFTACGIGVEQEDWRLLTLRGKDVLPKEAELATRGSRSLKEFWARLTERFTMQELHLTVQNLLRNVAPVATVTHGEVTRVLTALTDYHHRMTDLGLAA